MFADAVIAGLTCLPPRNWAFRGDVPLGSSLRGSSTGPGWGMGCLNGEGSKVKMLGAEEELHVAGPISHLASTRAGVLQEGPEGAPIYLLLR